MANDTESTDTQVSSSSEYWMDCENDQQKLLVHKDVQEKDRKQDAFFSSSVSAQDLRCLDMEKERQDISSPRGVLEACIRRLESSTVSPEKTNSIVRSSNSKAHSHWTRFFKLWKKKSIKRLGSFPPLVVPKISRKSRSASENVSPEHCELYNFSSSLKNFTFAELQKATDNFNRENVIGKGGYAEVYKGHMPNGQLLAIKRLTKGTQEEKTAGFLSELGIIAHLHHPNIATLVGSGVEGGMHLVFQLSPLGSLGNFLDSKDKLEWSKRYKIVLGTADGLLYLHETCQRRIIHRDIKADNILLTKDFKPQICDFGLAKWLPSQWTHHNVSKFEGTFGYFAPEYFMHGIVNEKTDVYAFGVLLLEIIRGHRVLDHLQKSLVIWAKPLLEKNDIRELVDPALGDNYNLEQMNRVVLTASLCIEQSPILRPLMSEVVALLRGNEYASDFTKEYKTRSLQRTYSEELLDVQEYNSTRYLSDLNRHMQVALGS